MYDTRKIHREHDWHKLPVSGISFQDAKDYAAWLAKSGKLPGARLCSELEWERAAKGADDREWPHGDDILAGDANFDATYNFDAVSMGPDEVGSYPLSKSPFGIDDMAGNAFEWTISTLAKDEASVRSSSYLPLPRSFSAAPTANTGSIDAQPRRFDAAVPNFRSPARARPELTTLADWGLQGGNDRPQVQRELAIDFACATETSRATQTNAKAGLR